MYNFLVILICGSFGMEAYSNEENWNSNIENEDSKYDVWNEFCPLNENSLEDSQSCWKEELFFGKKNRIFYERNTNSFSSFSRFSRKLKPCSELKFPYNVSKRTWGKLVEEKLDKTGYMDAFDLRDFQVICPSIAEITDQGMCDSCWAVAATDVMTDRLCLKSNGTNRARYSTADLLACCSECQNRKDKGSCSGGGSHGKAWSYWKEIGIVSGHYNRNGEIGCRNYKISPCTHITLEPEDKRMVLVENEEPQCRVPTMKCPEVKDEPTCSKNQECDELYTNRAYEEDRMKGAECYFLKRKFDGKEREIKLEIILHGPVHAFMSVYESFYTMFTKTPGLMEVEPYLGPHGEDDNRCRGHSIRIVGWGKQGKRNYWIAANSWGENWGTMRGFFHLDFNHDKVEPKGKEIVHAGIPILN